MLEITKKVTSKGQPEKVIKIQQAESLKECITLAKGEKEAVAIFNSQWVTNAMNKVRKPVADPAAKAISAALKSDKVPQAVKDKLMEELKKAGITF